MIPSRPKESGRLDDLVGPGTGRENWRAEQVGRRALAAKQGRDMLGLVVRCRCVCKEVAMGQDER